MNTFQQDCNNARLLIYDSVKKELLGPGSEDIGSDIEYELITDDPISRYSTGILFPQQDKVIQESNSNIDLENNINTDDLIDEHKIEDKELTKNENISKSINNDSNEIDEKISMANELKPSSMGITFFAKGKTEELKLRIKAAKYRESVVKDCCIKYNGQDFFYNNKLNEYIYREGEYLKLKQNLTSKVIKLYIDEENNSPEYKVFKNVIYALSRQCKDEFNKKKAYVREPLPIDDVVCIKLDKEYVTYQIKESFITKNGIKMEYDLEVCVFTRKYSEDINSYTVVLINNEKYENYGRDLKAIFQPEIKISTDDNNDLVFIENRDNEFNNLDLELDDEEQSLQLLFSKKKNYSIGHGVGTIQEINCETGKGYITTSFLPYYEVKGISFDIDGLSIEDSKEILSMKNLSDYSKLSKNEIINNLNKITIIYNEWINSLEEESSQLDVRFKKAAKRHINECRICLNRMKKGIEVLNTEEEAYLAFKLMNRALFMQRVQSLEVKKYKERFPNDNVDIPDIDFKDEPNDKAIWRPFQLAYILMCLESITNHECEDRDIVDLIWVPTGGGKTEAYLGLTAYTIFLRRIRDKNDDGTTVIMRYTLRLLAAQQFIRASILICACELIRREMENILGKKEITIGIWIGSNQTPNKKLQAKDMYEKLVEKPQGSFDLKHKKDKYNVFQVLKCPWCGTKLEKEIIESGKRTTTVGEWGYEFTSKIQNIFCTEEECPFGDEHILPIQVVDECIYEKPPTLLFGTVDKFAMITWETEAARLFALDNGNKNKSPELIIQDELHLISGPLGSIVGQYETAIDLMCSEKGIKPKIIASTATIKRAKEQCNQLYVRDVKQFPPSGLYEDDSFFTKEDKVKPGRLYAGIMPSGKTLTTTQVRLMSALTNRVKMLDIDEKVKSKYWTLVGYFNTLKELGMTSSLIHADIQDNIDIVSTRLLKKYEARIIRQVAELTSRKTANEINNTLKDLEIECWDSDKEKRIYPIDVLLASNMISVGVDVSRLNVMMVLQQPKLTSEYIQATSRVGRENPGIVFTLYNPSRSRDKSHYEMFYDYHQSFYKHVEPTSVTSFAESARDRMLHSVFIALVRYIAGLGAEDCASEFSIEDDRVIKQYNNILDRVEKLLQRENISNEVIDKEIEDIKAYLDNTICRIWRNKANDSEELLNYSKSKINNLIKPFGKNNNDSAIETLQSMRNVDQEGSVDLLIFEEETND